jgi:hypothetical protein
MHLKGEGYAGPRRKAVLKVTRPQGFAGVAGWVADMEVVSMSVLENKVMCH